MKKYFSILAMVALALSATAEHYKVITPMGKDDDGAMARLINYDTGAGIDSVLVAEGVATFEGDIDEPILARVMVDGSRRPVFILEGGTISFNAKEGAFGTMLNDQLRALVKQFNGMEEAFRGTTDRDAQAAILERYNALLDSATVANRDNALGYYMFLNGDLSNLSADELTAELAKYPDFAGYTRVQNMLAAARKRQATSVGNKYTDFSVTYDGRTETLSQYVKPGKYTLVDFWASWCGPCMRQAAVLKELYTRYHDKGLDIVGVAVWDEAENTLAAIKSHGLVWPNIIGAGTIPTDIYGISGIPCILLIGPDGTILSRDKQGDELIADVEKYIK